MTLARVQMTFGDPKFVLAVCCGVGLEKGHEDIAFVHLSDVTNIFWMPTVGKVWNDAMHKYIKIS